MSKSTNRMSTLSAIIGDLALMEPIALSEEVRYMRTIKIYSRSEKKSIILQVPQLIDPDAAEKNPQKMAERECLEGLMIDFAREVDEQETRKVGAATIIQSRIDSNVDEIMLRLDKTSLEPKKLVVEDDDVDALVAALTKRIQDVQIEVKDVSTGPPMSVYKFDKSAGRKTSTKSVVGRSTQPKNLGTRNKGDSYLRATRRTASYEVPRQLRQAFVTQAAEDAWEDEQTRDERYTKQFNEKSRFARRTST